MAAGTFANGSQLTLNMLTFKILFYVNIVII